MTSPTYRMDAIDQSVIAKEEGPHQIVSYHDMTAQPRHTEVPWPQSATFTFPYSHFAMIYIDRNGELQLEASGSVTGCETAIFTEDVKQKFLKLVAAEWQPRLQNFHPETLGLSNTSLGPPLPWYQSGHPRSAGLIPCEWQSLQNKRHRRNLRRVDSALGQDWESSSPSPSIKRTALRVGHASLLRNYYEKAFESFQQLNCRVVAKAFVKLVEPRKQVNHPYNGRKTTAGSSQRMDPELTKPKWWPIGVTHKEPDHLLKAERIKLLVHILCELRDTHGITADKLKDAGQDVRRQIVPATRLQVLDEIYYVREMEELYLDGKISGDTIIHVSHVHLEDELQAQVVNENIHEPPVPAITIQGDISITREHDDISGYDTQYPDRSCRNIILSSDDSHHPSLDNTLSHKRPASLECYLPISPASSPSLSRKGSLERMLSTYSSNLDPSMLATNESTRTMYAPKGVQLAGPTSVPDYFAHQFATPPTGPATHPGCWNAALSTVHTPLAFHGY